MKITIEVDGTKIELPEQHTNDAIEHFFSALKWLDSEDRAGDVVDWAEMAVNVLKKDCSAVTRVLGYALERFIKYLAKKDEGIYDSDERYNEFVDYLKQIGRIDDPDDAMLKILLTGNAKQKDVKQ